MKSAILLAILLVSSLSFKVELERNQLKDHRNINITDSLLRGAVKEISPLALAKLIETSPQEPNPSIDLSNFQDMQYSGPAQMGNENEEFNFVYDTGSGWIWISEVGCKGCPDTEGRFDPKKSHTYSDAGYRKKLEYGLGSVTGDVGFDHVAIPGAEPVTAKLIVADEGNNNEGDRSDGIIGLTPVPTDGEDLFVSRLAEEEVIDAKEFTVYIGKDGVDNSWIEFGTNQDDQSEVEWIDLKNLPGTDRLYYWSADFDTFKIGDSEFVMTYTSTIWDTGTSLIGAPKKDVAAIVKELAEGKKIHSIEDQFYGIECSGPSDVKPISFVFGKATVEIPSQEFIEFQEGFCIFLLMEIDMPGLLLGDTFLRGNKIIHDMEGKRLGLFPQHSYTVKQELKSE